MDTTAEQYVKLVLDLGQHDPDYVDAYYGPPAWREEAAGRKRPLPSIATTAGDLLGRLDELPLPADEMERLRLRYLNGQISALRVRIRMLGIEVPAKRWTEFRTLISSPRLPSSLR